MKILCFGSLNIDLVYKVDEFVKAKETIASISMEKFCGGKGLNQSIALKRAGSNIYHGGLIGEDGEILKIALKNANVNVENVRLTQTKTGNAIIQLDKHGQNCILLYGGANEAITKVDVDIVLENFEKGDYILLQNEISCVDYIIDKAYEKGMIIALNPSPMNDRILGYALDKISWFILNEVEGMALTKSSDIDRVLDKMVHKFPSAKILLTLGEKGASLYADGEIYNREIFETSVVDTTAAGDTFTGYFLSSIMQNKSYEKSLEIATMAASICVSELGASNSIPKLSKVLSRLDCKAD